MIREIYRSVILINAEIGQTSRSHLIIHELTRVRALELTPTCTWKVFLMNYPAHPTRYTEIDKTVIIMLLSTEYWRQV